MAAHPDAHPVRLVVEDDLRRNRLTVLFRLLLAIPHYIWIFLWSILAFLAAIANWLTALITGEPSAGLHRFLSAYVRYSLHLNAYVHLVGNPYPGFVGEEGEYPVDLRLPPPAPQPRWQTLIRILLAVPALALAVVLGGAGAGVGLPSRGSKTTSYSAGGGGALTTATAFLGWFASLALGRMPKGLRDAGAYGVGYNAQVLAYLLLLTGRYPSSDPTALLDGVDRPPEHPVGLVGDPEALRRSRVTVFFRLPLAIPHLVWLWLWSIAALLVSIVQWAATLATGAPQPALHRFLSRYVRYQLHVNAFLYLAANPFPGFVGEEGRYPLDLRLPAPARQSRWVTGFRGLLMLPALLVGSVLGWALEVAAVLTWFYALVRGAAPWGLRNLSAYALRYTAQLYAYVLFVTDAYPHASPLEGESAPELQPSFADLG